MKAPTAKTTSRAQVPNGSRQTKMIIQRTGPDGPYSQTLNGEQEQKMRNLMAIFGLSAEDLISRQRRGTIPGHPGDFPETIDLAVCVRDDRLMKVIRAVADYENTTVRKLVGRALGDMMKTYCRDLFFHPSNGEIVGDIVDFEPPSIAKGHEKSERLVRLPASLIAAAERNGITAEDLAWFQLDSIATDHGEPDEYFDETAEVMKSRGWAE